LISGLIWKERNIWDFVKCVWNFYFNIPITINRIISIRISKWCKENILLKWIQLQPMSPFLIIKSMRKNFGISYLVQFKEKHSNYLISFIFWINLNREYQFRMKLITDLEYIGSFNMFKIKQNLLGITIKICPTSIQKWLAKNVKSLWKKIWPLKAWTSSLNQETI